MLVAGTAKFFVESLFAFELPRCHAISALGEVVCYQFDAGRSLHGLIRRTFAALEPGGALNFDTVKAAAMIAAGQMAVAGVVPAQVAALTEGVLKTMLLYGGPPIHAESVEDE